MSVEPYVRRVRERATADPASVSKWRIWLDETQIDDEAFLGFFKIRTEDNDDEGRVVSVPFTLRLVQKELHDLEDQVEVVEKKYLELHIPKARKQGVSTHSVARYGFCRVLRRAGFEVILTAHKTAATTVHRSLLRALCAGVDWLALKEIGYEVIEDTRFSFAVKHPNGLVSRIDFLTARSDGLGRGGTPNVVISTERPHYPAAAKAEFFSILGSLRKVRGNAWIDESTANGEGDEFHVDCERARDGKGTGRLLFLPAYRHHLNYLPFVSDFDRTLFEKKLNDPNYGDTNEELLVRGRVVAFWKAEGLDGAAADVKVLEFLNWRRMEIDSGCRGSVEHFHQENPTILDEAFLGTGRPVFDVRILRTWGEPTDLRTAAATIGKLVETDDRIRFEPMPGAGLLLLDLPAEKDGLYCWGCDVASGRRYQAGTTKDTDWSLVNVKDVYTGSTVAKYRARVGTTELARMLILVARFYGDAVGLVELGGGYGDAVVTTVLELEDGAWSHLLMTTTSDTAQKSTVERETRYGFNASRPGKGVLAARAEEFINQEIGHFRNDGRKSPWDRETLNELKKYAYNERGGMEAASGHDDCAVAEMLALHARSKLFQDGLVPIKTAAKVEKPMSDARRALAVMDKAKPKEDCDEEMPGW